MHAVVGHGDLNRKCDGLVVTVDLHLIAVFAPGYSREGRQCGRPGAVVHERCEFFDVVHVELGEHLDETSPARFVRCRKSMDVTDDLVFFAHIDADDVHQVVVEFASVGPLHDRDSEAFFVDLACLGPIPSAADIDHMGGGSEESDEFVLDEHWRGHGDVVEVAGALPRIVREIDVTGVDAFGPDVVDEVGHCSRHRVDMAGCAGHGLGDHAALAVEDACGQVASFSHRCAERGADQGHGLFFEDRDKPVPHNLKVDFLLAHAASPSLMRVINSEPSLCSTA